MSGIQLLFNHLHRELFVGKPLFVTQILLRLLLVLVLFAERLY